MFKKLADSILGEAASSPTIIGWISGFVVVVLIRSFLELFSSTQNSDIFIGNTKDLHFMLFYLATVFLVALVVSVFTRQKGSRVINLALYGFPIIFLAPVIDLATSAGVTSPMGYLFDTHAKLLLDFVTFFGPFYPGGITMGMRIEILIILSMIGWYVWAKGKSVAAAFWAVLTSYVVVFAMCALPGLIYTASHLLPQSVFSQQPIFDFLKESVVNSNIPANVLHGTPASRAGVNSDIQGAGAMISQILYILSFVSGLVWFWYAYRSTLKKVLSNARRVRVLFYLSLLALGVWYAGVTFLIVLTWVDWVGIVVLALSWFSAWMFSVHINDIADVDIDVVSNSDRPLPQNSLTPQIMHDIGLVWLVAALVGSYIIGYYAFLMNIVFISVYYIYSAPPLRMKRVPLFSSFLISLACLATILAGFFFVSPNKILNMFPMPYVLGIVLVFTLGVNIRDIKDIEGDRAAGIRTLPVIFGAYGKQVVGALLAISFLLVPIFLSLYPFRYVAISAAMIGYWLCVRKPYKEIYIFALYFIFWLLLVFFTCCKTFPT